MDGFTPTERRLASILADGLPHRREELRAALPDDLGAVSNVRFHIWSIRRKVRGRGETVVCEIVNRRICYRHVRLLPAGSANA